MRLPEHDQLSMSREKMHADLAVAMGGRVAEELIFGYDKVTSGASSDISYATKMARAMVTQWGMSDKLGPLMYGENQQEVFLGHSVSQTKSISEATAQIIDEEVRNLVEGSHKKATKILKDNIDDLHKLGKALLEFETLSGDEIRGLLEGKAIIRDVDDDDSKDIKPTGSVPSTDKPKGKGKGKGDNIGSEPVTES